MAAERADTSRRLVGPTREHAPTYPLLIEALDPALVGMQCKMSTLPQIGNPITYFTARRLAPPI
jgi:hypothetical protein